MTVSRVGSNPDLSDRPLGHPHLVIILTRFTVLRQQNDRDFITRGRHYFILVVRR